MKKKFLKITSVIVLLLAMIGFWGYNQYFKPDPKVQQQLYNQFGAGFFTSFGDDKGVSHSGTTSRSGTINSSGTGMTTNAQLKSVQKNNNPQSLTITGNPQVDTQAATASTSGNNSVTSTSQPLTEAEVVQEYMPQIQSLQNIALGRLETLYSAAKNEYKQDKKAGTLNTSALASKYIQAGNMLQANVDSQFDSIISQLQADLAAHNLPTDQVGVIENEYAQAKAAERSRLLAKAF